MARSDPAVYVSCPAPALEAARLGVPLRTTSWTVLDALWALLASILLANALAIVGLSLGYDLSGPLLLLTAAVPWIAMAGWPLLVTRLRGNGAEVDLGWRFQGRDVVAGLIGGAACFGAAIVSGIATVALFGEVESAAGEEAEKLADSGGFALLLLFALMVFIGAPIAEELTFRGLLWSGLAKRGARPWVSIAVTTIAFAAIHFEPERLIILLSIGGVLGAVRWRTGSLGACIIAHAMNNFPGAVGILVLGMA